MKAGGRMPYKLWKIETETGCRMVEKVLDAVERAASSRTCEQV